MIKRLMAFSAVLFLYSYSFAQDNKKKPQEQIRQYWFVMLLQGNNRSQDSATAAKTQEGHMANINKLYSEGKLKVAGPFGDDDNWRGIFIFDVSAEGCKTKEWKNC